MKQIYIKDLTENKYIIPFSILLILVAIFIYGYMTYWPQEKLNAPIMIEFEVLSIKPKDASLNSNIEIFFNDHSKRQIECNCSSILRQGDTQVIIADGVIQDHFTISLTLKGKWKNAVTNLRVNGTDKGIESFIISANNSPMSYNIPSDISNSSSFKRK